jgi:exodeoxyribonuclease VII large subunit
MSDSGLVLEKHSPGIYTVSGLTEEIKELLEARFDFVWVEGEISNFRVPSSRHYYMVLKDEKAQIRAVMFRPQTLYLKFMPEDGMKVIAQGRLGVYEPRGEYQLILDYLEPLGVGALALAFEQLKRKLAAQGIFDRDKKKPLPFLPQRVAVITSPTGAAIRDFLKVIHRRFANIEIILLPVKVQGEEATAEMVEAIEVVNRELRVDVIVLTRGGGSLEDLWAFNEEALALAIGASRIPVVSAVGHETDVTISDLAADLRAPTPSAAAELLVVEKDALEERLLQLQRRLESSVKMVLGNFVRNLKLFSERLRDPRKHMADLWLRLDDLNHGLTKLMDQAIRDRKMRLRTEARALLVHSPANTFTALRERVYFRRRTLELMMARRLKELRMSLSYVHGKIKDLSPLAILKRGYSITRKLPEERILKGVSGLERGDRINILLAEGELECSVDKIAGPEGLQ